MQATYWAFCKFSFQIASTNFSGFSVLWTNVTCAKIFNTFHKLPIIWISFPRCHYVKPKEIYLDINVLQYTYPIFPILSIIMDVNFCKNAAMWLAIRLWRKNSTFTLDYSKIRYILLTTATYNKKTFFDAFIPNFVIKLVNSINREPRSIQFLAMKI